MGLNHSSSVMNTVTPSVFPIARAAGSSWIIALEIGLVGILLVGMLLLAALDRPALALGITLTRLAVAGLLADNTTYSLRTLRVEVNPRALHIRGDLYGRHIPTDHLKVDPARIVDLRDEPALQPVLRTNGIGLPGTASAGSGSRAAVAHCSF